MKKNPKRLEHENDITTVMQSPQGRRFMWTNIERCGVFHRHSSERNEGRRDVGLDNLGELADVCPQLLIQMLTEHWIPALQADHSKAVQGVDDDDDDEE